MKSRCRKNLTHRLTVNAKAPNPLRVDPTRTSTLRRQHVTRIRRRFALLRGRIIKLVTDEDAFGLKVVTNYDPDQARDDQGRFSSGGGGGAAVHEVRISDLLHTPAMPAIKDAIKGLREKIGSKFKEYIDKTPGGKYLREKSAALSGKLKERYGEKTMGRIVSGATSLAWGITIGSAALGTPIPVPAAGLVLAGVALAETHLQVRRAARALTGNEFDPDQPRDDDGRFAAIHGLSTGAIKELASKWAEKQGSEEGLTPKDINEGFCSWFAHAAVRSIQEKRGREVGVAGHKNEDADVYTSRTNMDSEGEGHMWVTAGGKHFDAEAPHGVNNPTDLPWFSRHPGFSSIGRATLMTVNVELTDEEIHHEAEILLRDVALSGHRLATNRWQAVTTSQKVDQFQQWLRQQYAELLIGANDERVWHTYAEAGYKKGAGRAFDDSRKSSRTAAQRDQSTAVPGTSPMDFHAGTRDEFLRSTFAQPVSVERIKYLASRSFDDLENVTSDLSARLSRSLGDGLTQGTSPRELARSMSEDLDISQGRAELIARTEIIRAHSEGQLDALENMGVEEVGVMVEWLATEDGRQCEECASMAGSILDIEDARGMIPFHPNCRCCWVPAVPSPEEE